MRGQVLDVVKGEAYLCIGSKDGAQVGQELAVYRHTKLSTTWVSTEGVPIQQYKREKVGMLKIKQIVDIHYATATVLSGNVLVHDVAELE